MGVAEGQGKGVGRTIPKNIPYILSHRCATLTDKTIALI